MIPLSWRRRPRNYLRAVNYFGRAQPLNFWDSALLDEAPAHLESIRRDGFDAVILVIPWRGFQRTVVPSTFDDVNLGRLRRLLFMVRDAGLKYVIRISFPWNNDPLSVGDADERTLGLFSRRDYREGWLDYVRTIRRISEAHSAFQFAFFSWEEFPSIREHMAHRPFEQRLALAGSLGFRDYLAERYSLAEVSRQFGKPFASFSEVYIPLPDCEAYRTYVEFVNYALATLLADGRAAWPKLGMQLRVDMDRTVIGGENVWIENDLRLDDSGMRATYFFSSMYGHDQGEKLTAAEGLANLKWMLRRVSDEGRSRRHFLDQFIFHDESPQYAHSARIHPDEMEAFLAGAGGLLERYSHGFAFWCYWDYRVNHLYNAAFLRGLLGWETRGEVTLGPDAEPRFVTLAPGAAVVQRMDPHAVGWGTPFYETMRFALTARAAAGAAHLRLTANGVTDVEIDVANAQAQRQEVAFSPERHRHDTVEVALENTGTTPVEVTDLNLWAFVYRHHIYDENGKPGRYLEAARAMLHG